MLKRTIDAHTFQTRTGNASARISARGYLPDAPDSPQIGYHHAIAFLELAREQLAPTLFAALFSQARALSQTPQPNEEDDKERARLKAEYTTITRALHDLKYEIDRARRVSRYMSQSGFNALFTKRESLVSRAQAITTRLSELRGGHRVAATRPNNIRKRVKALGDRARFYR